MEQVHVVLGANGAVGKAVIKALQAQGLSAVAVGRSVTRSDIPCRKADVLNLEQVKVAVEGASHVYLCVGLPYRSEIWSRDWPTLMQNVIEACASVSARLIFLDNVYMYGPAPLAIPFDEAHLQHPTTKKGKARKQTADLLLQAIQTGQVQAVIGRAADFYGPGAVNSPFYLSFLERMLQGKAPQSVAVPGVKHTYAYVPDIGRALVALALEETTYGQVWHLPVGEAITVEQMQAHYNAALGTDYQVSFLPAWMRKLLSWFIPTLKEVGEMNYQYETEYRMSFEKFRRQFPDFEFTSYQKGVEETVKYFQVSTTEKKRSTV